MLHLPAPGSGFNISGRIESGHVQLGESIMVLPAGEVATVKGMGGRERGSEGEGRARKPNFSLNLI